MVGHCLSFCYIGKRNFEAALAGFMWKDKVEVEWKSFQLDPSTESNTSQSIYEYLAARKGMSLEHSKHMHQQLTRVAAEAGLEYNFDKVIVANTFDAHRLIHLAARHGKQEEAEERLFSAYFTEGKNLGDMETLAAEAEAIGIDANEARIGLQNLSFSQQVNQDFSEARQLGISGVPFFVFNRKFAVSGAQPTEIFAQALARAWDDEVQEITDDSNSCSIDGSC